MYFDKISWLSGSTEELFSRHLLQRRQHGEIYQQVLDFKALLCSSIQVGEAGFVCRSSAVGWS